MFAHVCVRESERVCVCVRSVEERGTRVFKHTHATCSVHDTRTVLVCVGSCALAALNREVHNSNAIFIYAYMFRQDV